MNDFENCKADLGAVLSAGAALGEVRPNPHNKRESIVLVPEGFTHEYLQEPLTPPRSTGTVRLRDAASFVTYFNRQKRDCSLIYATLEPARFLGVVDDHFGAGDVSSEGLGTNWREYRVDFTVPASREWLTWKNLDRHKLTQLEFAEFIEDNLPDITKPSGSDMLTMALNFEAAKDARFISNTRLDNGNVEFMWKEVIKDGQESAGAGQKLTMPQLITISIPVFENGPPVEMPVRIKYRVAEGSLKIWYELVRPHKVMETAFRSMWEKIETDTKTKILLGSPE